MSAGANSWPMRRFTSSSGEIAGFLVLGFGTSTATSDPALPAKGTGMLMRKSPPRLKRASGQQGIFGSQAASFLASRDAVGLEPTLEFEFT